MSPFAARRNAATETPDAVGRGTLGHDPAGPPTLFVLSGPSLGATAIAGESAPRWYDLRTVANLDAVGEDLGGRLPVEVIFTDGETVQAIWPEPFCDKVVQRLRELLEGGDMSPVTTADGEPAPSVSERPRVPEEPIDVTSAEARPAPQPFGASQPPGVTTTAAAAATPFPETTPSYPTAPAASARPVPPPPTGSNGGMFATGNGTGSPAFAPAGPAGVATPVMEPAPAPAPAPPAPPAAVPAPPVQGPVQGDPSAFAEAPAWSASDTPLPGEGPALATAANSAGESELVLHDVVYHGGYPGQTKKRKKCTAVLNGAGLTVSGPSGTDMAMGWEAVNAIEAQNADEAKFRLGIRAKRNSTTLVFDCREGVQVLLEARDVPTLPLRSALTELLGGRSVTIA